MYVLLVSLFCSCCLTFYCCYCLFALDEDDDMPVIHVDPEQIGDQGDGLVVTPFWSDEIANQLYDGYEISTLVDVRDVRNHHYKLSFIGKPGNLLLYTKPLLPATFVEASDRAPYEAKEKNVKVKQGHNTVRVQFDQLTMEQQRKTIRIEFPDGVQLSDVPYGSPPTRQRILGKTVPYSASTGITAPDAQNKPKEVKALVCRMTWRVVDMRTAREVAADDYDEDAAILDSFQGLTL